MRLAGVVILAGGNSKRMGTPKAKLKLPGGETLLNYHVRHATPLNVPIMIADNEHGFKVDEALAARSKAPIFHIKDYGQNDKKADIDVDPRIKQSFQFFKTQFNFDDKKYMKTVIANRFNAKKSQKIKNRD